MKRLDDHADLDQPVPVAELMTAVRFPPRVEHRVAEYLEARDITMLSPRQLMDLFLPAVFRDYGDIPIRCQPQFGKKLHIQAMLSLCEANMGKAFQGVWAARVYFLKLFELRYYAGKGQSQSTEGVTDAEPD